MHRFKWNFDRTLLFAPDNKEGNAPPPADDNPPADDAPDTGDEPGKKTEDGEPFISFKTKDEFQKAIDDRLKERLARKDKEREEAEAKAKRDAEREALKQKEEFKTLSETQEKELGELRPTKERYDQLSEMVKAQIEAEVKDWPEDAKNLLPDEPTDVLSFMRAVERVRPVAAKLKEQSEPPTGNLRGPKPSGPAGNKEAEEKARRAHERWAHRQF